MKKEKKQKQDVHTLFQEFGEQVEEIVSHASQVQKVQFHARLKNGTLFSFSYNSNKLQQDEGIKETLPYQATSPFNAIVDICGAVLSIVFLVLSALRVFSTYTTALAWLILGMFSLFGATFVVSSLFHFFPESSSKRRTFSNLFEPLKLLALIATNLVFIAYFDSSRTTICLFVTLLCGGLSLFFVALGTKGGLKMSQLFSAAVPFLVFILGDAQAFSSVFFLILTETVLFGLWNIIPFILPSRFSGSSRQGKSNNSFAIIAIAVMFFLMRMLS